MPTTRKSTLLTAYLGLVSLISFIWLAIAIIIFAHSVISKNIITNDEYISQNHREIDSCEDNIRLMMDYPTYDGKAPQITKTQEELTLEQEECITKAKANLALQRNIDFKETMILSGLRMTILLVIFPLHFIYFRKSNK